MSSRGSLYSGCSHNGGFTFVEMMIVVAIIGILASIAYPSYQNYLLSSRRAEAQADMLKIQLGLEKWRANNNTYTNNLASINFTDTNTYYSFQISNNTGSSYTITATAQGSQTSDTGCTSLTLDQSNIKTPATGCWKN